MKTFHTLYQNIVFVIVQDNNNTVALKVPFLLDMLNKNNQLFVAMCEKTFERL